MKLRAPRLYLVTDRHQTRRPLCEVVEAALAGGVDAVQLREKDLGARDLLSLAEELRRVSEAAETLLLVNDRVDVALACGAAGVHLTGSSLPVAQARALLGPDRLLGASTHSLAEAQAAERDGVDFVVFGPIFPTPSKSAYGEPQGLDRLRAVCAQIACPVVAIGGITSERVPSVLAAGAYGIAVISAIIAAADPQAVAQELRLQLAAPAPPGKPR